MYVAFGRPKGDRGSYKVWEEGGIFPQVVFEVWSPNNRFEKMQDKFRFYEKHGVEECDIVYPEFPAHVDGWRREAGRFVEIEPIDGWVSPRLGTRFRVRSDQIALFRPDGSPFLSFLEMAERANRATEQAAEGRKRAERLAARLYELGIDPDAS